MRTLQVQRAIAEGRPVVALESTIISHGMPYPRNLEMAREVEEVIRKFGAVPATIAIIDGVPKAGLNEADLLKLASNKDNSVLKASTRDMAHACTTGATAATTTRSCWAGWSGHGGGGTASARSERRSCSSIRKPSRHGGMLRGTSCRARIIWATALVCG